jgi:hypothetical protein
MTIKTLAMTLKPLTLASGWYQDPATGQWYYYDDEGRRYIYIAGYLYPAHAWEPAPKVVNVSHGDTLRIPVSFKYTGPARTVKLYGCIGNLGSVWPYVFDEVLTATAPSLSIPQSSEPITRTTQVDIPVTAAIASGRYYAIYAKLIDGVTFQEGTTGSYALKDAVFVVAAEPTFSDFAITDYVKV